jgi:hypothetical protein
MARTNGVGIGALLVALVCLSCAESGQPVEARDDLYLPEEDRSLQSITVEPDGLTLVYDTDARDAGLVEGLLVAGAAQGGTCARSSRSRWRARPQPSRPGTWR